MYLFSESPGQIYGTLCLRLLLSAMLLLGPLLLDSGSIADAGGTTAAEWPCHGGPAGQMDDPGQRCCEAGDCFCELGASPGAPDGSRSLDTESLRSRLSLPVPSANLLAGFARLPDRPPNGGLHHAG